MKKSLLLGFIIATGTAHAEVKMVPLDIELGHWETNAEMLQNDSINKLIENMPEAQRAMMREMMQSKIKIPTTKQCITKDTFKDMNKQIRESMGDQAVAQDCNFEVISSNSKSFSGKLVCKNLETFIHTKVINSKRQESAVEANVAGMGVTKLSMVSQWKTGTCP